MPVYQLQCPQCSHQFSGMVFFETRPPAQWICPECGSEQAKLRDDCPPIAHPLEASHGSGCPCCSAGGEEYPPKGSDVHESR